MPSISHEVYTDMVRGRPELAAEVLAVLGIDVPKHIRATTESTDLTDLLPTEYRSDAVIVLHGADRPVLAVIVEVQRRRDKAKLLTWPVYVTTLRRRWNCPAVLLVICDNRSIAQWCAKPIDFGLGLGTLRPMVFGPDQVPIITDPAEIRAKPELAMLSLAVHPEIPRDDDQLRALVAAMSSEDDEENARLTLYYDFIQPQLPALLRKHMEVLMNLKTYEPRSDIARSWVAKGEAKGKAEGIAEGRAEDVLAVLETRGITVPAKIADRIGSCADLDQLAIYLQRAVVAERAEDVL